VRDEEDRGLLTFELAREIQALALVRDIANCQYFIKQQNIRIEMGCY
jgi:hypothetical protein